ncbi:MAG TPA: serine hydrolase [Bacteroidales bacterium]|nr:serine hydrolase [Bacteroidales bacterium]HRX96879.1 serine hydrolase [Bacteroidales bacterium]
MKSKRKLFYKVLFILLVLFILSLFLPKYVQRYFYWNFADIYDSEKFPKVEIKNDPNNVSLLAKRPANFEFVVPEKFYDRNENLTFETFIEDHDAVALLVLKRDTIIYENYFDEFNETYNLPSFSVSKSFVSALTGIAIDEGYIYSTKQSITFFLKELGSEFNAVSIEDLLNMRSGIEFNEGYTNPFADMPKYYYGTDLLKYVKDLKVEDAPDLHYNYISVNTLLLGQIIERATNTKLNNYLEKKIWIPAGMESEASWNVDSEEHETIKAFCCINAVARDFARFGLIYLHEGYWNNRQIVPAVWVKRSTSIINDSRDSQNYPYTYQWRVLENGAFFAKGILGQYILVYPEKELVFVRLGKSVGDLDWADLFISLSDQIN